MADGGTYTPEMDASQTTMLKKESVRDKYLKLRSTTEAYLATHTPQKERIEYPDGARVDLFSTHFAVPEELKIPNADPTTDRITIFVPGIFHSEKQVAGTGDPLETKLAASLLKQDTDHLIVLKGKGLNENAYVKTDTDGTQTLLGEERISEAMVQKLMQIVNSLPKDKKISFRLIGYSEGSTQAASLAQRIVELCSVTGQGTVDEVTSISAGGIAEVPTEAPIGKFSGLGHLKRLSTELTHEKAREHPTFPLIDAKGEKQWVKKDEDTIEVDSRIIGNQTITGGKAGGLEDSLGRSQINTPADVQNLAKWGLTYLLSRVGKEDGIPTERLRALWQKNPNFEKLARRGIPIKIFAGYYDQFFPYSRVEKEVARLRSLGGNIQMVATNVDHNFPHYNPAGIAFILEATGKKREA